MSAVVIVEVIRAREAFRTLKHPARSATVAMYSFHMSSEMLDARKVPPTDAYLLILRLVWASEVLACRVRYRLSAQFVVDRCSVSHVLLSSLAAISVQ